MADAVETWTEFTKTGLRGRGCKFCSKGCGLWNCRSFHRGVGWSYVAWIYPVECSVLKIALSFAYNLREEDIPGLSLEGRNPFELKNDGLRFWLKCKGDKWKGLKTTGLNKPTTSLKGEYLKRSRLTRMHCVTSGPTQYVLYNRQGKPTVCVILFD